MFLSGLGTAAPPQRFSQAQCWEAFRACEHYRRLGRRAQILVEQVLLGDNGIAARHLVPAELHEVFHINPDTLHRRFAEHAPRLATEAALRALDDADLTAAQVDAVIASTCTGYLCPGITSYLIEGLGLCHEVLAFDLVGQGCAAALPNWSMAEALLSAGRARHVLSVCVEVSSAALYVDDDPGVLISGCLFGDGAGAALLSARPPAGRRRIAWQKGGSLTDPGRRDLLRFEQRGGMLRNILTRPVPQLAARYAAEVLGRVLKMEDVAREEIGAWIWHAGGRDVLFALQERLGLSEEQLRYSRAMLAEYGNLSSAFVYFVLEAALRDPAPGRALVDVILRRRLQLPRRLIAGGLRVCQNLL